ncbi:hypothetical protein LQW54_005622 [Pestalotiopsis sp. IQ-011]
MTTTAHDDRHHHHHNQHSSTPKPRPILRQAVSEQTITIPSSGRAVDGEESPHPSASSRANQQSRQLTPTPTPTPGSATSFTSPVTPFLAGTQPYQRHTTDVPRRTKPHARNFKNQPRSAAAAVDQGRISQLVAPLEDMSVSYYAHKQPPWKNVGLYPVPWAQPLHNMNHAKRDNDHHRHDRQKNTKQAPGRMAADPRTPRSSHGGRASDVRRSAAHPPPRPSPTPAPTTAAAAAGPTAKVNTMSMGPGSIMIGFDSAFGSEQQQKPKERLKEHWAPLAVSELPPSLATPLIADLSGLDGEDMRIHDSLSAAGYEDLPMLLPSSVYRRESGPTARTAVPSRPATTDPNMGLERLRQPSRSTIADSPSDAEPSDIWDDEVPGSADVPDLTPSTGSISTLGTKIFTLHDKAVPDTPGLPCPGCMIGGKRPQAFSRGTPRDEHRGTLQYPEERESGFCNACRNGDLMPDISRFTLPDLVDDQGRGAESAPEDQTAEDEATKGVDVIVGVKAHVLDSRFRLGRTKESKLASRRRLQADAEPLRPASAPQQNPRISHIAQCQVADVSPIDVIDGSDSDYGDVSPLSPLSGISQQLGGLPSHFSIGGDGSIEPLRVFTPVTGRKPESPNTQSRRSLHGNSVIVTEIDNMIEDWESDIFKEYGALSPIDTSKALISPMILLEKSLSKLKRHSDMSSAKSADSDSVTPRTYMYNRHRRDNGDF